MAFNNTSPLSYASGEVVKYIGAQRGLSDDQGGPALTVVGFYNPSTGDLYDPGQSSNTSSASRVTANATSQQLIAANNNRKGLFITNEQTSNNTVLVKFGGVANSTSYSFVLYSGASYEMGAVKWTGNVHVLCTSSTANVQAFELT